MLVGIPVNPVPIDVTELQATEVRIENIFRYANVYQKAIDLVDSGRLNLKPFITDTFAMKDAKVPSTVWMRVVRAISNCRLRSIETNL